MANTNIQSSAGNLNIDPVLLAKAIEYSKSKKRDLNKVINAFLLKLLSGDIDDFDESLEAIPDKKEKLTMAELEGRYDGQMWMSDDFDDPIDDLKAYK